MEKFRKLKLSEDFLKSLEGFNFKEPSDIQEKTIPLILEGKDVLGSSATGSGKTLAFGSGIIEKISRGNGIQALILTPTRELAEQVAKSLRAFSRHTGLQVTEIFGGVSIEPQIRNLRRADVVVGTPGRILDHINRRTINFSNVKILVLDEADRMLEMGFIEDVTSIINTCPKERQTLLFSATISKDIERIAKNYMKSPVYIAVEPFVDPKKLAQSFFDVPSNLKFSLLVYLLKQERPGLVMVFCNTRRNVDLLTRNLKRYEIDALGIHGGLTQNKRSSIMSAFHSNTATILICTDVAARGLDIKNVSHIYNYDIPKTETEYIHRIGRTARAGKEGRAISLVSERDYHEFRHISEDSSITIEHEKLPELAPLDVSFKTQSYGNDRGFRRPGRFGDSRQGSSRGRFGGGGRRNRAGRTDSRGRFGNRERREGSRSHDSRGRFRDRDSRRNNSRESFRPQSRFRNSSFKKRRY